MSENPLGVAVTCLSIAAYASIALAQQTPTRSFDQLQSLVRPGDTVTVTDRAGHEVTGKIADLSATTLVLTTDARRREFRERDVTTIHRHRSDSLLNGAIAGAVVGGLLSLLPANACNNSFECTGSTGEFVALGAGFGTGIGLGVDALIRARQVLYTHPSTAAAEYSVGPLLTAARRGLFVMVRF